MHTDLITELKPTKSAPLLGFWYPVTTSTSLAVGQMHSQVMLGQPILICRDRQRQVAAMRDICPH
ncbi:MAG: Rieske 2Fe-2S domain-containing protein, partial [Nitrospira sp.]